MLNAKEIIEDINDDFITGNVDFPLYVEVWVMPEDYGKYKTHRFLDDKDGLVSFLFETSLSKKIISYKKVRGTSEISVSGWDCAVVGYELHCASCKEVDGNITPDLIECLGSLMTTDKYIEFGWLDYGKSN